MNLIKVHQNKYITPDGYCAILGENGSFSLFRNKQPIKYGLPYRNLEDVKKLIDNYKFTGNIETLSQDDVNFIYEMYASELGDSFDLGIVNNNGSFSAELHNNDEIRHFDSAEELIQELDNIVGNRIFCSVIYRGSELRPIVASSQGSARITDNLVRVRSSNIWAYGVEVKDKKKQIGDVYVQFKGQNGGKADIYRYYDVPLKLWRKFITAPSKGHFLWKYLRNNFLYSKLTGDKRGKLRNAVN